MKEKMTVPCGRLWDHEPHLWYTNPQKQCPGVVASEGAGPQSLSTIEPKDEKR